MSAVAPITQDEHALYHNLCLLGVSSQAAKNGIEIVCQSFRKPNPRALELVLFYLYAAICGEAKANKVGSSCITTLTQTREHMQTYIPTQHTRTRTHIYINTHSHTHTHTTILLRHAHTYTHTCMHSWHTHACTHTLENTCIYIHTHTYTHTRVPHPGVSRHVSHPRQEPKQGVQPGVLPFRFFYHLE
jgi:hypothetical protein